MSALIIFIIAIVCLSMILTLFNQKTASVRQLEARGEGKLHREALPRLRMIAREYGGELDESSLELRRMRHGDVEFDISLNPRSFGDHVDGAWSVRLRHPSFEGAEIRVEPQRESFSFMQAARRGGVMTRRRATVDALDVSSPVSCWLPFASGVIRAPLADFLAWFFHGQAASAEEDVAVRGIIKGASRFDLVKGELKIDRHQIVPVERSGQVLSTIARKLQQDLILAGELQEALEQPASVFIGGRFEESVSRLEPLSLAPLAQALLTSAEDTARREAQLLTLLGAWPPEAVTPAMTPAWFEAHVGALEDTHLLALAAGAYRAGLGRLHVALPPLLHGACEHIDAVSMLGLAEGHPEVLDGLSFLLEERLGDPAGGGALARELLSRWPSLSLEVRERTIALVDRSGLLEDEEVGAAVTHAIFERWSSFAASSRERILRMFVDRGGAGVLVALRDHVQQHPELMEVREKLAARLGVPLAAGGLSLTTGTSRGGLTVSEGGPTGALTQVDE